MLVQNGSGQQWFRSVMVDGGLGWWWLAVIQDDDGQRWFSSVIVDSISECWCSVGIKIGGY